MLVSIYMNRVEYRVDTCKKHVEAKNKWPTMWMLVSVYINQVDNMLEKSAIYKTR